MDQPLVFISYSHKDEALKDKLLMQLGVLQSNFDIWSDDRIGVGANWKAEIDRSISRAKVAILLITDNFLSSPFILQTEVKTILERREKEGMHVFPVIAKACAWTRARWLSEMNVRPKNKVPVWGDGGAHVDEYLASIVEEVADILESALESAPESTPVVSDPPLPSTSGSPISAISTPTAPQPATPETDHSAVTAESRKILIADDEADYRRAVIEGLEGMSLTPYEAGSVRKGIKILEEHPDIRVILLDLDFEDDLSGTILLDHIKDRASYYRVIILTAHPKKLAAEEASSHKSISNYLEKGKGVPREQLRFAVVRAFDELKREGPDPFEGSMVRRYPTPFEYIFEYLESQMSPLERLISQKDMFELLLHFSGIALLCEYLNSDVRNDELDSQIRKRITKPSLGDWFNIINEIVKRTTDDKETFFLRSFLKFFTGKNKKILNDFIGIRNTFVGHGTKHSDSEYESVVGQNDAWLQTLLEDYHFITDFLLCYVINVQILRGTHTHLYTLRECVGANPQLLKSTKPLDLMLTNNEMHLVRMSTEPLQSLSLYPFMILENCLDCRQLEIFFFTKFSNGQLQYLSYKTGHRFSWGTAADDFQALLKMNQ